MKKIRFIDGTEAFLVVRCKECKHFDGDEWCWHWNENKVKPDDFCSYGEADDEQMD